MGQTNPRAGIYRKDPEYGEVTIDGRRAYITEPFSESKWEYLVTRSQDQSLIDVYSYKLIQGGCCSGNSIEIEVEYIEECLDWHILQRRKHGSFSESDMWYIAKELSRFDSYIDLHPYNIRLNHEGRIKILDLNVLPHENLSNYEKVHRSLRDFEYLSPEQLMQKPSTQEQQNSFILGVIMLVCLAQLDVSNLYDLDNYSFNFDQAHYELDQCFVGRPNLSKQLRSVMEDLILEHPEERLSLRELRTRIDKMDYYSIGQSLSHDGTQMLQSEMPTAIRLELEDHIRDVIELNSIEEEKRWEQ